MLQSFLMVLALMTFRLFLSGMSVPGYVAMWVFFCFFFPMKCEQEQCMPLYNESSQQKLQCALNRTFFFFYIGMEIITGVLAKLPENIVLSLTFIGMWWRLNRDMDIIIISIYSQLSINVSFYYNYENLCMI